MNKRLQDMVKALGPVMPETAAEITLRATALTHRKAVESLGAEDLPAIEAAVRDALQPVASDASIELTLLKIRELFLRDVKANGC